jgi:PAS domain S-box-containing protein
MPPHILVVEDSPTQAQAVQRVLESAGYEVELARSGEEGLTLFNAGRCDVVISDVVMPGAIDGYELCRRIKSGQSGRATPVMLLTSLSSPMDIIHGLASGADNFLTKPYDAAHLVERVQVLLRTREARASHKLRVGVEVYFMGQTFNITSDREQILDLLISTFEDAVRQNQALREREDELRTARAELAKYTQSLEMRLESVLQSVPDVLFSMSADLSEMSYMSPAAMRVTGYAPQEYMADAGLWRRLVDPNDVTVVQEAIEQARRGETTTAQFRMTHLDGTVRWLDATVVPVRNADGVVERLDGIAHDVTAARQLENKLVQAQKMEMVGQLAGGVAHDFNNLLCVILGWAEMALADLPPDHAIREPLDEIRSAGESAMGLTRQLLAFSRRQLVEPAFLNVNDLVADMDKMLRRLIGEHIEFGARTDPEIGTVKADRGQIEQVLMNLVVNARDAMPAGGSLTIETSNVTLDDEYPRRAIDVVPGEYVMLAVSDTGTGMSETIQARIFEPFFTTKERDKGTGLGLATCYGIAKQAGGHIAVYSEEGLGTTMKVYLPRRGEAADAVSHHRTVAQAHGAETILLVEDEPAVRRVTSKMLEAQGYRVVSASGGEEALRIVEDARELIDLLLTDVVLAGGMNGGVLAERARTLRPALRVLFASGYTSDMTILHGLLEHGVTLAHKPFTSESLGQKVREVLDAK